MKFLVCTTKQNCEEILSLKQQSETWRQTHYYFFQSIQFSVIFRQHKKNLISSHLGSYFLLKDFPRLNFALRATFNQHLYCLALHCECLIVWLANPIFSFPVHYWNERHLLKGWKASPQKGQVQEKGWSLSILIWHPPKVSQLEVWRALHLKKPQCPPYHEQTASAAAQKVCWLCSLAAYKWLLVVGGRCSRTDLFLCLLILLLKMITSVVEDPLVACPLHIGT